MKKHHTTYLITVFAMTSLLGFFLASQIVPSITGEPTTKRVYAQSDNAFQHRLLVAHVDDLNASDPMLASLWLVIISDTEPVSVTFKVLYPSVQQNQLADDLSQSFQLTGKGKLAPPFLKAVNKYQVFLDGYILVDDEGLKGVLDMANPVNTLTGSFITSKSIPPQVVLMQETQLINNACGQLGSGLSFSKLKEISNRHLHLELEPMNFSKSIESIESGLSPYCEIAPLQ